MNWQTVFVLALAAIILYFLLRIRSKMKAMPGATEKMNAIELIKNWQAEKAKEAQYQNDLKARAKELAKPQVEKIMMQRFVDEEIRVATTDKSTQAKDTLKSGLGLDIDKAASRDNIAYMTGRPVNNNNSSGMFNKDNLKDMGVDQHKDIFSKMRIEEMTKGTVSQDKLRNAASNNVNWEGGVKKALTNENKMSGLDRALYGNKK